jgi:surface antigen
MISIKALGVAETQIGKHEDPKGSNWGHPVQDYLLSVGITFPAAWCMAFVYWCFKQVGNDQSYRNPLYKTGGVMVQWSVSAKYRVKDPQPGDVFIMSFDGGKGHTGFVESVSKDTITTVEGNTDGDGGREGWIVARRTRKRSSILGYLRFT